MKNAEYIYTRHAERTRQRVYSLSTPILLEDYEQVSELLISSTLDRESPSTHVLPMTSKGVRWQPLLVLEGFNYEISEDAEIDSLLLEELGFRRKPKAVIKLRSPQYSSARKSHPSSFSPSRALGTVLNWMQPRMNLGSKVRA